ncbi:hypothetical protein FHH43_12095 [Clostridium perfringens]|nr:hypothetical protein [Clostridium perfringens]
MSVNSRCDYKDTNGDLDVHMNQTERKNQSVDAFCFNCEKGFSVNDGGYFIVDEPYCSLECVIEAIIKEINSELKIKKLNRENIDLKYLYNSSAKKNLLHLRNHYNLDSTQKERIIEFTKEKDAEYLIELLEKVLYES